MQMPGRNGGNDYRYAFNGMEHDPEVSGDGNSYTTEFRHYDPRLGRWKSLDPLMSSFPHISAYAAYANNPILFVDPYGLAPVGGGGEGGGSEPPLGDPCTDECGRHLVYVGNDEWEELPEGTRVANGIYIVPNNYNGPGTYGYDYSVDRNQTFGEWYDHVSSQGIGYVSPGGEVSIPGEGSGDMLMAWFEGVVDGFARPAEHVTDAMLTAELLAFGPGAAKRGLKALVNVGLKYGAKARSRWLIYKAMRNPKMNIQVAQTADDLAYLNAQGAEAVFITGEGGTILLRPGANKITVLEEIIHYNQYLQYGEAAFLQNRTALEIAAQRQLLQMGATEGWAASEFARIQSALQSWEKLLQQEASRAAGQ